jgi:hypothetical protein
LPNSNGSPRRQRTAGTHSGTLSRRGTRRAVPLSPKPRPN